jgi:hypothetical protein
MAASTNGLLIIERILRDRDSIWRQIGEERDLGGLTGQMLASSVISLACYGAVLGASHSFAMSALSAVKLPLLFLMTIAICLPTLYLFNLVFGARLQVRQALALVMVTVTVTSVLALAFAPIALFFRITAHSYSFYKMLNVGILTLAAFVGLKFLTAGMHSLNRHTAELARAKRAQEQAEASAIRRLIEADDAGSAAPVSPAPSQHAPSQPADATAGQPAALEPAAAQPALEPAGALHAVPVAPGVSGQVMLMPNGQYATIVSPQQAAQPPAYHNPLVPARQPLPQPVPQAPPGERPASMTLLYVWIVLFGFVGTQLAWTLRPFVGSPGERFQLFREIDGNFYVDIVRTIGSLF